MFLPRTLAMLFFFALTALAAVIPSATAGFGDSCRNVKLDASYYGDPADHYTHLQAECPGPDGVYAKTSLDISPFIGNFDGKLKWDAK